MWVGALRYQGVCRPVPCEQGDSQAIAVSRTALNSDSCPPCVCYQNQGYVVRPGITAELVSFALLLS